MQVNLSKLQILILVGLLKMAHSGMEQSGVFLKEMFHKWVDL